MSEIARWDLWDGQMSHSVSGLWVRYAAHQFEVERLATELAEAHERCRALELSVEQADEMKAHAEASAAAEEAETDRVTAERDAAQAEVERLTAERDEARAEAERRLGYMQLLAREIDLWKAAFPCSTPEQMLSGVRFMDVRIHELTKEREGWRSYAERMTAERDAAQAEVERLTQELDGRRATNRRVIAERDEARAEVARLKDNLFPWATYKQLKDDKEHVKEHVAKLTAERDAAQAEVERLIARLEHAQARIVPPLSHTDESASLVQGKMDAYVTSLNAELHETRERLARVQTQYDEFARVTAKTIDQHQRERDDARQQVYRLQQACGQSGANGQGMLDTSRPTDEDIWREAFMRQLFDHDIEKLMGAADLALALYRKRWPR